MLLGDAAFIFIPIPNLCCNQTAWPAIEIAGLALSNLLTIYAWCEKKLFNAVGTRGLTHKYHVQPLWQQITTRLPPQILTNQRLR